MTRKLRTTTTRSLTFVLATGLAAILASIDAYGETIGPSISGSSVKQRRSRETRGTWRATQFYAEGKPVNSFAPVFLPRGGNLTVEVRRIEGRPRDGTVDRGVSKTAKRSPFILENQVKIPQENHVLVIRTVIDKERPASPAQAPWPKSAEKKTSREMISLLRPIPKDAQELHHWWQPADPFDVEVVPQYKGLLDDGRTWTQQVWRVNGPPPSSREEQQTVRLPTGFSVTRTFIPIKKKNGNDHYTLVIQTAVSDRAGSDQKTTPPKTRPQGAPHLRPRALQSGKEPQAPRNYFAAIYRHDRFAPEVIYDAFDSGLVFLRESQKVRALREKAAKSAGTLSRQAREIQKKELYMLDQGYGSRLMMQSQAIMGPGYFEHIQKLKKGQHWIIIGPGRIAVDGYAYFANLSDDLQKAGINFSGEAKVTAIGTEPMSWSHKRLCQLAKGLYSYLAGRPLEKYTTKQIKKIGQADLVTDQFGALSYTDKLDTMLAKELEFVKVGGKLIFNLPSLTRIRDKGGRDVTVAWLKSIKGVTVTVEQEKITDKNTRLSVVMVKNSEDITMTSLALDRRHKFREKDVPTRVFRTVPGGLVE